MIPRRARAASFTEQEAEPSLDLSSLIDVSSLLLICFLITSSLAPIEADLQTRTGGGLDENVAGSPIEYPKVEINALGIFSLNGELIETDMFNRDLQFLAKQLRSYKEASELTNSTSMIILDADDASSSQRFIDVMNCLAKVGISNLSIRRPAE